MLVYLRVNLHVIRFLNFVVLTLSISWFTTPDQAAFAQKQGQAWGNIRGKIVVEGKIPKLPKVKTDPTCRAVEFPNKSLVVDKNGGLKNVVIFLKQSRALKKMPIHPSYEKSAKDLIELDNKKCQFSPHIVFVRKSQTLFGTNSDPVGHNINVISTRRNAQNKAIPARKKIKLTIKDPERVPIPVLCGSHSWMKAYLFVREEPYVAISAKDGSFEIKNMPVGNWDFQFWHEIRGFIPKIKKGDKFLVNEKPWVAKLIVKDEKLWTWENYRSTLKMLAQKNKLSSEILKLFHSLIALLSILLLQNGSKPQENLSEPIAPTDLVFEEKKVS